MFNLDSVLDKRAGSGRHKAYKPMAHCNNCGKAVPQPYSTITAVQCKRCSAASKEEVKA